MCSYTGRLASWVVRLLVQLLLLAAYRLTVQHSSRCSWL
jgi:hypothetical protein